MECQEILEDCLPLSTLELYPVYSPVLLVDVELGEMRSHLTQSSFFSGRRNLTEKFEGSQISGRKIGFEIKITFSDQAMLLRATSTQSRICVQSPSLSLYPVALAVLIRSILQKTSQSQPGLR